VSSTHDAPKGRGRREALYDTDIPTPTHAERARTLVANMGAGAAGGTATLCTVAREPEGHPYGSFVAYGMSGSMPVFLVSHLAEHTRNMLVNDRVSLLVAEPGTGDPLARGRVTLVGTCAQLKGDAEKAAREAYLAANPGASYYVDFKDFSLWGLQVSGIRYIGGYGRMSWVESSDWSAAAEDPIAVSASRILAHMNGDHQKAMALMCLANSKATTAVDVKMTSIDTYGCEMSIDTGEGRRPIRVAFSAPIKTSKEAREQLVALTKAARAQLEIDQV